MAFHKSLLAATTAALGLCAGLCHESWAQGRGGGGGGRSPGNHAPSAPKAANAGPAMTRPAAKPDAGKPAAAAKPGAGRPAVAQRPGGAERAKPGGAAAARPNAANKPAGVARAGAGQGAVGANRPGPGGGAAVAGKAQGGLHRPNADAGGGRPKIGGNQAGPAQIANRADNLHRPGAGASSSQVNDFLGMGSNAPPSGGIKDRLPTKDNETEGVRGKVADRKENAPGVKDRRPESARDLRPNDRRTEINVGDVNVGNSIDYSNDQTAWISNRHEYGNQVRLNAGNRYGAAYSTGVYRRGIVGGYPYYTGWANRGPYYGWTAASYVAFGAFMGAAWANTQPVYYAYGNGGNVYYENNTVYVNGQAAGTAEQYAGQLQAAVAATPTDVNNAEWLPLGAFAFTREGVDDSQAMLELAVDKQGVIAGTYFNEATSVSRAIKGTVDRTTQRVAMGFADGKNENLVFETGIYNLTQDEAPGMLHFGTAESQPILLVRLTPPADTSAGP